MSRLQNKVAVITGGTSGIGLAAAQRFVAEGAFVYIFARRQDELDKTVASIGRNVAIVQGDVRELEDLDRLYAKVASDGRKIDVVVANVGAVNSVKLADVTIESFNHNFDVNARGVLFTVQKSLPLLNNGASVILTSTIASCAASPVAAPTPPPRPHCAPMPGPGRWSSRTAASGSIRSRRVLATRR